jgi:hypothetical protein
MPYEWPVPFARKDKLLEGSAPGWIVPCLRHAGVHSTDEALDL